MAGERASAQREHTYIAIDLKSFYASVECVARGLDPLTTHLVVADETRTDKTICLAVSPSLKNYGIPGRARLFEVKQRLNGVNIERAVHAPGGRLIGESCDACDLERSPGLKASMVIAKPRMAHYLEISGQIYGIYLKYAAPEHIHVYSIDEVFIDATNYLNLYRLTPEKLAMKIILDILENTGITATAGIGTNLYLAKVAMDIVAKHIPADKNGVRIAQLDELRYRQELWSHRPLTDFWRVGPGYAKKLEKVGLRTMGDVARCSVGKPTEFYNEDLLYKLFGVNAQLLIDHAWGWEPCTIADIKAYKPESSSISPGQVLQCPYTAEKARLVVREMADDLSLDLVDKGLVTDQIVLTVGYDIENLPDPERSRAYQGPVTVDRYGRRIPKHAHGTANLGGHTASSKAIVSAVAELYDRIVNSALLVRRLYLSANHIVPENSLPRHESTEQLDFFSDFASQEKRRAEEAAAREREKRRQQAVLAIKKKYGKNAILKGMDLEEGATARDRNGQIGGHKA